MSLWFFASDLHGQLSRYQKLFRSILRERPEVVLLGGDLLPNGFDLQVNQSDKGFIDAVILKELMSLQESLQSNYPQVLIILGNDDPGSEVTSLLAGEKKGVWRYIHNRHVECGGVTVYGYACVPPTPFMLKDWERYDISHFVDPGCIPPQDGWLSVPSLSNEIRLNTIQSDLDNLTIGANLSDSIFLFHSPPYKTALDRAALDGMIIESAPIDVHVGSIAIRRFIEARQPRMTLHGHIHESPRLTGSWREQIGGTYICSAAHDGAELALVRFDPNKPGEATRELI
jgi:Icc-related predicted phosphoesterase